MKQEQLEKMNKINEDIKFLTEVVNKIEEGFQIDVRLKYIRTINSFSVYPYL